MNASRHQPKKQQFTIVPPAYPVLADDGFPAIQAKGSNPSFMLIKEPARGVRKIASKRNLP